jgi:hypothetical protein
VFGVTASAHQGHPAALVPHLAQALEVVAAEVQLV